MAKRFPEETKSPVADKIIGGFMIKEWLEEFKPKTNAEADQALREIIQEIALFGLERSGFFEKAAFYGGTALRIFHNLPRFSEDLDFSLLSPIPDFSLEPHLDLMVAELVALGIQITVKGKIKTKETNVDSAFLKADTVWKELILKEIIPQEKIGMRPEIKIKLEVDTMPPQGFSTEQKLLLKPASFYVNCFSLPDLFAGKMHALLFRKWKNRVKGRDWFDLEWYIKKGIQLHLEHLERRARDSGDWPNEKMTKEDLIKLLNEKVEEVSLESVREDVSRFIPDDSVLNIWTKKYFHDLIGLIKIS